MNEQENFQQPQRPFNSEFAIAHDRFAVGSALQRNPWASDLLENLGKTLPQDLKSSLRVAYITADVLAAANELGQRELFTQQESDAIILGGALQDIGRGFNPPEIRHQVYSSGVRWRDDPNAWQWDVVKQHPVQSHDIILATTGDPKEGVAYHAAQIVFSHHALKRQNPYPEPAEILLEGLDDFVKFGIAIVSAVDVAEAVSKNYKGEGRPYLQDEEFVGRTLSEIVRGEIIVDEMIAKLAAAHTLRLKGISLKNV